MLTAAGIPFENRHLDYSVEVVIEDHPGSDAITIFRFGKGDYELYDVTVKAPSQAQSSRNSP